MLKERMIKERDVERHLVARVKELGGIVRKVKWICCANAPDRLVMLKGPHFVELKAPGEVPRPGQAREFARMELRGAPVTVLSTIEEVNEFIQRLSK